MIRFLSFFSASGKKLIHDQKSIKKNKEIMLMGVNASQHVAGNRSS